MTDDTAPGSSPDEDPPAVPTAQLELLWLALESGYFRAPRESSISEIAAQAGISDLEASRLLRRGIENVLRHSEFFGDRTARRGGRPSPLEPWN